MVMRIMLMLVTLIVFANKLFINVPVWMATNTIIIVMPYKGESKNTKQKKATKKIDKNGSNAKQF